MTALSSPAQIMARLEEIRQDIANRRSKYEKAAYDLKINKRDYEYEMAVQRLKAKGTVQERSDRALAQVEASGTYERLKASEGLYEGLRAGYAAMDQEAMILMALLKGEKT